MKLDEGNTLIARKINGNVVTVTIPDHEGLTGHKQNTPLKGLINLVEKKAESGISEAEPPYDTTPEENITPEETTDSPEETEVKDTTNKEQKD